MPRGRRMTELPREAAFGRNGKAVSAQEFYTVACDPARSVAVEACAGAGKTWMLVSRIVRALLDGMDPADGQLRVSPHEILAITFTKRAAGEMRARLYSWLQEFAAAPAPVLLRELQDRGVSTPGSADALEFRAQQLSRLYQAVLRSGRQVQIRTFHSWFAALLRASPLAVLQELGLPVNYELLEDDETAVALVWRRFYQALVAQAADKQDFEALVLAYGRFQIEKALSAALDKRIEFTLADAAGVVDESVQHFGALYADLAQFGDPADALELAATRQRWLAWAQELEREANKTPRKAARYVLDEFSRIEAGSGRSGTGASWRLALLRRAFFVATEDRLTQHLLRYPAAQAAALELGRLCAAADQHAAWTYQQQMARLTRVLITQYAALKHEHGWVDMPDVERAAVLLLSDPVLSGWVQERLDSRVRHLLIDEFQDTSPMQWQALSSWLGSYAGAVGRAPSVFIVGDPKQSIYRFRRAEPQVFLAAQQFVVHGLGGDQLSCDHTRRNAVQVIATVNTVMAAAAMADGYDGFRSHTTSSIEPGQVWLLPPIPRPEAVSGPGDQTSAQDADWPGGPWRDSLDTAREVPEEALRSLEARQAACWIAGQLDRGVSPKDVMVLSRRRANLMPVQAELRARRIAAQVGEKTTLIDSCEVQDMVALLDALVSDNHDLSLARALKSPLFGVSDAGLTELALRQRECQGSWFSLLQQAWPAGCELPVVGQTLMRWKSWLDRLPPHDALQSIYCDGDVLARFAVAAPATQREPVLANLRALLVAALEIGGGRYATPYAFVRAIKAGGLRAPATVDGNAVRLLTVHGAKGLEADTVVLLDTDTPERAAETMGVLVDWPGHAQRPRKFVFLANENQPPVCARHTLEVERAQRKHEELNALYVALTRARQTLVVSSVTPHRDAPASWWQRLAAVVPQYGPVVSVNTPADAGTVRPRVDFSISVLPKTGLAQPQHLLGGPAGGDASGSEPSHDADPPTARVGKAMHRLLEWGDSSQQSALACAREFNLSADQIARALDMAQRIRRGAGAWTWDGAIVCWQGAEVELLYRGETLRLDRLVQRSDTGDWWVLDFKSAPAPQEQSELVAQLRHYRCAVQEIYPTASVRAAFLSPTGELIELEQGGD